MSTVASLACQVDAFLGVPSAAAGTHLAAQMQRSALEALASLSRAWAGNGTTRLRELERGLGALYELKLYTRIALQDPAVSSPQLSLISALGRVSVDSIRSLLRLLPEGVW